jgi:lactate dehydrogenase-like 2-hydroxyacid dehydrogenase
MTKRSGETVLIGELAWERSRQIFEHEAGHVRLVATKEEEANLAQTVRATGARGVIVGVTPFKGPLYDALPEGGVISRYGVGFDSVDLGKATAKHLIVTNTPGALDASVAELALWFMGMLARPMLDTAASMRLGKWEALGGLELSGRTLAVLGLGRIGRRVARMAGLGLGMRVVAFDCLTLTEMLQVCKLSDFGALAATWGVAHYTNDLAEALADADFVSVNVNLSAQTRNYMNAERLGLMKRGAFLVNTARGPIVDEIALYDILASGHLGGAGLDVFHHEPYVALDPQRDLRTLPNVIMTPHIASNTGAANAAMASRSLANVRAVLEGRWQEAAIVNTDVIPWLQAHA